MKQKSNWVIDEEGSIWEKEIWKFVSPASTVSNNKLIMTGFESPSCIWARKVNDHINDIYPQED